MPSNLEVVPSSLEGVEDSQKFLDFLESVKDSDLLSQVSDESNLAELAKIITPETPIVYWSMEFYDKDENDIKGGGGLGVLAADTRRVAEQLGIPLIVVTPFYPVESHQELWDFKQAERHEYPDPKRLFRAVGQTAVNTLIEGRPTESVLDVYDRKLGSTTILTVTQENFEKKSDVGFQELYAGSNSGDHRLYQEIALGFAGYKAIKKMGIDPPFMQLNEAPTVFAAIARLDDLCGNPGVEFDQALEEVKKQMLFTNHTLVQAVEGEFDRGQFDRFVMPNVGNENVKNWLNGMFSDEGKLKLSSLAIEIAGTKSGVSELHARVSDFKDRNGEQVKFEAVTNGISRKWTLPETLDYYHELDILDEFDLPTSNFQDKLYNLDAEKIRDLNTQGRKFMNDVLANRQDQYGNPINVPEDALVFDFKRRFANYKRPDMMFNDPGTLAYILEAHDAHIMLTGKPHPSDEPMKNELTRLLNVIHDNPTLKERVHYIQDYDEEVGKALSIGADCAINVPVVGQEACGTSWMKDMSNFKLLISTPDGGVADSDPIACLEVNGNETESLYWNMTQAAEMLRDNGRYKSEVVRQLKDYMPVISGSRMMASYLSLFHRLFQERAAVLQEAA